MPLLKAINKATNNIPLIFSPAYKAISYMLPLKKANTVISAEIYQQANSP